MNPKIGVVDVGGGFQGIYAAGVLDYCMHKGIWFDFGIGVSAGSANLASYCAKQPRRNHKFYTEYGRRKEYMSMANYFHTRSYLDLQYIYGTLTNSDGECPLYYDIMMENPMEFLTVISCADTGRVRYISKQAFVEDSYTPLIASCALPGVCRPVSISGTPSYD